MNNWCQKACKPGAGIITIAVTILPASMQENALLAKAFIFKSKDFPCAKLAQPG